MKEKINIPENSAQVEELITEIAKLQKKENKIIQDANIRIKRIRNGANGEIAKQVKQIKMLVSVILEYYLANKKELTQNGKLKIIKLCEGIFWEYLNPISVIISGDERDAIKELKKLNLQRFIRIKEEVDKAAIGKYPAKIARMKHIKLSKEKKKFAVTPYDTGISSVIDIKVEK